MPRATRRRSARDDEPEREDAPARAPAAGVAELLGLQRAVGNHAVAQMLARRAAVAPPVKDRKPIDDLAAKTGVKPVDRVSDYAKIAGTGEVQMDPAVVSDSGFIKDGLNVVRLTQASNVPAKTDFVDAAGNASGGAPPENATGVAIVVNSNSTRFEDEDYMVAAIRHEMVHARLMRLTLKHRAAWKKNPQGLSFAQFVDQTVSGTDGALVKDRFFGGHMDETVAYAEGFLSAFFYAPLQPPPGTGTPAWRAHLDGFGKELQKARANSGGVPKDVKGIDERNLAIRQSANAVIPESEKLVKEYCDGGGPARRKNLGAWMEHLQQTGGVYEPALKLIYKAATGKALP